MVAWLALLSSVSLHSRFEIMKGTVTDGIITLPVWRRTAAGREDCQLRIHAVSGELLSMKCTEVKAQIDELVGVTITSALGPDGRVVKLVRPTNDPAAEFRNRVLTPEVPCPPGYEDLRQAYLHALEAAAAEHGGSCPDCEQGEIRRRYLERVKTRQDEKPASH
jgi:hypothetical protein